MRSKASSDGTRSVIERSTWEVKRIGMLEEVQLPTGATRFRVSVADEGRKPFIVRYFNDIVPASDFLERFKALGE
jgi:hypothetical protein